MSRDEGTRATAFAAVMLALVGLIGLQGFMSWRWMYWNGFLARPPISDAALYRLHALRVMRATEERGVAGWLEAGFSRDAPHPHPPGLPLVAGLFALPEGEVSPRVCWATTAFFEALLMIGTWRLARCFVGPWAALGVVAVTQSAPVILEGWDCFFPQLPMAAMVILALDQLIRSRLLGSGRRAVAFGVLAGLAAMVKVLAPVYLAGSVLAAAVLGARVHDAGRALRNLALAMAAAAAVAGPWYLTHLDRLLRFVGGVVGKEGQQRWSDGVPLASLERWTYYPRAFLEHALQWPLGLLVCGGAALLVARALRRRKAASTARRRDALVLAAGALVGWPILTLGQIAAAGFYVMSFVPLAALALVASLQGLAQPWHRIGIVLVITVCLFDQWLAQRSFEAMEPVAQVGGLAIGSPVHSWLGMPARLAGARAGPAVEDWPGARFLERIRADAGEGGRPQVLVMRLPRISHPYVFTLTLRYQAELHRLEMDIWDSQSIGQSDPVQQREQLSRVDYVIADHRIASPEQIAAFAASQGRKAEVLATETVTPVSTLSLMAVRRNDTNR